MTNGRPSGHERNTASSRELAAGEFRYEASWHYQFKDSSFIHIGGLDSRLSEGDVIVVFSEFGQVQDFKLYREGESGRSLGFGFLGYEDPRSAVLAVDNFLGLYLLGKLVRVRHVAKTEVPTRKKTNGEDILPSGPEGEGLGQYYMIASTREALHAGRQLANVQRDEFINQPRAKEEGDDYDVAKQRFEDKVRGRGVPPHRNRSRALTPSDRELRSSSVTKNLLGKDPY